jgi:N-succinyl-L-ornithine transcarbamylase
MRNFLSIEDVANPNLLAQDAINLKKNPFQYSELGKNKVLGLLFFNSSLRTRMSTTRAAYNLGMSVMVLNVGQDSWTIEMEDGAIMDQGSVEHIKEAAAVMGQYCEILGVRSFPTLQDRAKDYSEYFIQSFSKYAGVPIVNLESATVHPLQSLADLVTITEHKKVDKPKVVLTWAPHIKALPQSVPNSFSEWMNATDFDFTITHPEGFALDQKFSGRANIEYDQDKALRDADFVYVKNWSSFNEYGEIQTNLPNWQMTLKKLGETNDAKLMHCLPVRRNVVISDDALDSHHSIVIQQASNRVCAAQAVLKEILTKNYS